MTETAGPATGADVAEAVEVFVEAAGSPIAGGRWEILADDVVRSLRQ